MGDWKAPTDCKYTKTDEWVRIENGEGVVGITDFAQSQLSDLVYVELPHVGDTVRAGDEIGVVESVKAAAPLKSPVSGEVVAVNEALEGSESTINQDPFGSGWIVRIRLSNPAEMDDLMDAATYQRYCDERA